MSAVLLTGAEAGERILEDVRIRVAALNPLLVIIQVGDDAASNAYIRKKKQACESVGMRCSHEHLDEQTSLEQLIRSIHELNEDTDVSGYILQLPLPSRLSPSLPQIMREIDPKKDVDGFTAYNLGKTFLSAEFEHLPPATPAGIIALLEHYRIEVAGKHVVIVGRSTVVGKPLSVMLVNRDATVTLCHSKTSNLSAHTKCADILVSAVGKPHTITADMVKKNAVVVDVGISRTEDGLTGDVDFESVKNVTSAITPVPGGVGPMTVACLLRNVVRAKERQNHHQ